ncbi:glycosyl hydrolase [Leeuwenhoekiella parthenopeia]|uniref:Beta-mannosidase-like galactose-binding domain-containing protein n=1 Tax=Leeuwenhoekiella parthenopeia TaxID=2890320 RepID=A0ABS8GNF0_9FLAO|nr:glycosyl hydrolase [Leeuwenhoekiella parthenopeia]MCC4211521.1 hypothetical protein [Leeuwenhoekiella parthenopeia]
MRIPFGQHSFLRFAVLCLMVLTLQACEDTASPAEAENSITTAQLLQDFKNPPTDKKPWLYWYWINNHISEEGITKDLEAMAEVGIGAALIGNIYLPNVTEDGQVPVLSEEWERLTRHAISEGARLGVDIGLFNSPGWSQSGGPWNDARNSMRYLKADEIIVTGPARFSQKLQTPADFQDVSLLAFPKMETPDQAPVDFSISATPSITNLQKITDRNTTTVLSLKGLKALNLDFRSKQPVTLRSLSITPSRSTFVMQAKLLAQVAGDWEEVRSFRFDRSNDMETVGFIAYPPVSVSFPAVTATHFKLELTNISPTRNAQEYGIAEVALQTHPVLEFAIEKQLGKMHQTPLPLDDAYRWPAQIEPESAYVIQTIQIQDLSSNLASDGTLTWDVPEGEWTILRMGMVPTGVKNAPAAENASGYDVDKINKAALKQHFDGFIGRILKDLPAADKKAFKYVVADSYETGGQNWTYDLEIPFKETYGYDPKPWLPVITGRIVNSVEESNRFLWDLRRLVADRVAYEYVGGMRELCEENGLQLWLENYGHWGFPSEFLTYGGQSHLIGGEFWAEGDLGSIECKAASSAAHIYGKNQVSAESFTAAQRPFQRHPGELKKRGDWSYTEGINHRVFHVYIEQPYQDSIPGVNTWFGTEFNRHNTWFTQSKPWIDYERRAQVMLQQGLYVADIAYFIGEDAPKMTGVTDPELPKGYSFDYINAEVLLRDATVKDGRITLPDGMSYRILVLPNRETMRPQLLEKIKELVSQGAVIMGNPPVKSPSLENYGSADERVQQLAQELWGNTANTDNAPISFGKGSVFKRGDLARALQQINTPQDVELSGDVPVLWTHRTLPDHEIYFLTNQSDSTQTFTASFRVSDLKPQFWDLVTGNARYLTQFTQEEGRTQVQLTLAPAESGFIVFSNEELAAIQSQSNAPVQDILSLTNPWNVEFKNEKIGIDTRIEMDSLVDWTQLEQDDLRYFSGTATYTQTFELDSLPQSGSIFLSLEKAEVFANIKVNDIFIGGLWTAPWELDITDALKAGTNRLEIEVTNLWVNQLIGDSRLEAADKKTWTLNNPYSTANKLMPSGLQGPVKLRLKYPNYLKL